MEGFLPMTKQEQQLLGIDQFDFICVTGDAYVDHPSFGVAIISRILQSEGFTVGIIAQPRWCHEDDFRRFGSPRYGFFVTSGNVDSMVAHYTVSKRLRQNDSYSPGGVMGKRPDRAVIVYANKIKKCYPNIPIILGGIEASLRRFAHYDYWTDQVMPSILEQSTADLLVFGMGELQTREIAKRLSGGESIDAIRQVRGSCYLCNPVETPYGENVVECESFSVIEHNKKSYAKSIAKQVMQQDEIYGKIIVQRQQHNMLVQNPPMRSLTTEELDQVYAFPYQGTFHPYYNNLGGVPAIQEVEFSITHNRGCFGGCNFCAIAFHQGKKIAVRSEKSVLEEAIRLTYRKTFKGYIHDVGGPTANFRLPSCEKQLLHGLCAKKKCLAPLPCEKLVVSHTAYANLLEKIRQIKGIKKVFIRSGIRYDYLLEDPDQTFFNQLVTHHISGQLKVAPEHCSYHVLDQMGKPHIETYLKFMKQFNQKTLKAGKKQYLVPYLISSHPGSRLEDAIELALFLKKHHIHPEQVQDFYPTPGTISTCMYHTERDPFTLKPVYVPKLGEQKALQRALLQYFQPHNKQLVYNALRIAGRLDLIGYEKKCLIQPITGSKKILSNNSLSGSHDHHAKRNLSSHDKTSQKRKRGRK